MKNRRFSEAVVLKCSPKWVHLKLCKLRQIGMCQSLSFQQSFRFEATNFVKSETSTIFLQISWNCLEHFFCRHKPIKDYETYELVFRSSCLQMFFEVRALKSFQNLLKKTHVPNTFFNTVAGLGSAAILKKWLRHRCFPRNLKSRCVTFFVIYLAERIWLCSPLLLMYARNFSTAVVQLR